MSETDISSAWSLRPGVTYLNHGAFGLTLNCAADLRQHWQRRLAEEPTDFYLRQSEPAILEVQQRLGQWLGAPPKDLALVDNATVGMNVVARTVPLAAGDEVLLTDHEYGAVRRIWEQAARPVQAKVTTARLPFPLVDKEGVVAAVMNSVTPRTRLIVISHVTSPTAVILPVAEICRAAKSRGVPVCIDGPHALAMLPVNLKQIRPDFYCASAHKWLCGPNGSGILYVSPAWQSRLVPPAVSWGDSLQGSPKTWQHEFHWWGTRDPSANLALPAALDFFENRGWEQITSHGHALVSVARQAISERTGLAPLTPDSAEWYGPMVTIPIPNQGLERPVTGQTDPLQAQLWQEHRIEVPLVWWRGQRHIRVSCHLYNTTENVARLLEALQSAF